MERLRVAVELAGLRSLGLLAADSVVTSKMLRVPRLLARGVIAIFVSSQTCFKAYRRPSQRAAPSESLRNECGRLRGVDDDFAADDPVAIKIRREDHQYLTGFGAN
jgi:hypothetical protein